MRPPSPARLRMGSAVNIVWDGNSLVAGVGATGGQTLPVQVAALAPVAGSGAATSNVAIGGQTWDMMTGAGAADVDAAWVAGKTNVLIAWETTNTIAGGQSPETAAGLARAYLAERLAAHPWLVVLLTAIPRQASSMLQADHDALNGKLALANEIMQASYRSWGAHVLVDVRQAGSPFAFGEFRQAQWDATAALWYDAGPSIHLTNAGYAVMAAQVAAALRRLPVR